MKKDFQRFIYDNFKKIIEQANLGTWEIEFQFVNHAQKNGDGTETELLLNVIAENKSAVLVVYDRVKKYYDSGQLERIINALCHEVGHMITTPLAELAEQPYKSQKEVEKADELLSTQIGQYLYKILTGEKHKCQNRKVQKSKTTKQKPNKKR